MRALTPEDLAYERIASTWEEVISHYDTARRIDVLIGDFLTAKEVEGRSVLDAGCGLGYFSMRLAELKPRRLVSIDVAPQLVERLARKLPVTVCRVGDLLDLTPSLGDETFDLVFSSEVIEHTPDPPRAVAELSRRVHSDGSLVLSCPNRRWIWLLVAMRAVGMRRAYQGYENWPRPDDLVSWIEAAGLEVVRKEGIHLVPWALVPKTLLKFLDRKCRGFSYGLSLNLAIKARRLG